jgi:hypothetical protein
MVVDARLEGHEIEGRSGGAEGLVDLGDGHPGSADDLEGGRPIG